MTNIIIADLNRYLIQEVKKLDIDARWSDYFAVAEETPNVVLMTASNPKWTFGGGLDAIFAGYSERYSPPILLPDKFRKMLPQLCTQKQKKGGGMERIGNIVFAITVDENLKATPEIIEKAIRFGLSTLKKNETLVLSGIGTGVGGLAVSDFCRILERIKKARSNEARAKVSAREEPHSQGRLHTVYHI